MTWQLGAALNAAIGLSYLAISWLIVSGLRRAGQLRSNRLALATAAIFLTCGVHHGGHTLHMLGPLFGADPAGLAFRRAVTWQMDVWDLLGAAAAIYYLSLRRAYVRLLDQPEMFENLERRRYEEQLERERALLDEAQAVGRLGSWETDLVTGVRTWSNQLYEVMGLPPGAELVEDGALEVIHPEDRAAVLDAFAAARERGGDFEVSYRRTGPNGEVRHLRTLGRVVLDDAGRPSRLVGTTQDVTNLVEAELARASAEDELRLTIDHAPIGVALVDLTPGRRGRLLTANRALSAITGHPIAELERMSLSGLIHPDEERRLTEELRRLAVEPNVRVELELRAFHADGHALWILLAGGSAPGRTRAVFHLMDIGERKRFEGQLQHLADHDALTGLYNRRRFEAELSRVIAESARYERRGAVMLLDLDGFKFVNDTLGHSVGDELVTRLGAALRSAIRDTDVIGRLGGDEFAVILPDADETDALNVAEKLLGICRDRTVVAGRPGHRVRVTGSIGITLIEPTSQITAEELLVEADISMYEAKEAGKDQACVYRREHGERIVARESWLDRLRYALAEGRLELYAQPIVGICSNGLPRYELLLRMRGDDGELIPPGVFLYNAERFDLIQQIDRWVFGRAAELLHRYTAAGHQLMLSVNLSARTLTDNQLLADLSRLLDRHPILPGHLIVEVTETAAIVNIDRAREVARGIRQLGCRFALDDFGAGFASFYYLKHLEFDYLKIDGEFIKNLPTNTTDRLVVHSVVDIARQLGAETIAEFVGSDETVELLRTLGVGYGQGYHLGTPGPVDAVLPTLSAV